MIDFFVNWLANTPAFVAPFALAALGLIITEKSGVLSLGAEGLILVGAMAGAGAFITMGGHPFLSLAIAALAAALVSLVFAVLVVSLRVSQVIAGLTLVFLCQGLTALVAAQQGWTNVPIAGLQTVPLGALATIPVLGPILFRQDIIVYLLVPVAFLMTLVLSRTMIGLRLRAVGENSEAADAAGISVSLYRYGAIVCGAALVGIAGGYLSIGVARIWVDGMSGGRGWIAIALVIFSRWQPWRAVLGAVLFGSVEAALPRIAAVGIQVPQYFVLMTPYLATLGVMIWSSLRLDTKFAQPAALGRPHMREERR
jgi:ABC-type uncharacterized transport system permease subunit